MENNTSKYIKLSDASNFASVSLSTIKRFIEAGYLKNTRKKDNVIYLDTNELKSLFGIADIKTVLKKENLAQNKETTKVKTQSAKEIHSTSTVIKPVIITSDKNDNETKTEAKNIKPETVKLIIKEEISSFKEGEETKEAALTDKPENKIESNTIINTSSNENSINEHTQEQIMQDHINEIEIIKFKNIVALQDKILDLKDSEIKDLKQQRDWFKERIAKLEEKSEKDQLLLISETQLMSKIIASTINRKSKVQSVLEWVGLKKKEPDHTKTIGL